MKHITLITIFLLSCMLAQAQTKRLVEINVNSVQKTGSLSVSLDMKTTKDLTGKIFSRLTVISLNERRNGASYWNCKCECGSERIIIYHSLTQGHTKSCGCFSRDNQREKHTTHGASFTKEYNIWKGIKQRCFYPKHVQFDRYGGRGITMHPGWVDSYENFIKDMGPRPSSKHSVDRKDNNGNYEPGNCRWATKGEQSNNTSVTIKIPYKNSTVSLKEYCDEHKLPYATIRYRIQYYNWPIERALTEKIHHKQTRHEV